MCISLHGWDESWKISSIVDSFKRQQNEAYFCRKGKFLCHLISLKVPYWTISFFHWEYFPNVIKSGGLQHLRDVVDGFFFLSLSETVLHFNKLRSIYIYIYMNKLCGRFINCDFYESLTYPCQYVEMGNGRWRRRQSNPTTTTFLQR